MPYPPQEFDIDAFHAAIDAVVMGRDTYEIERGMGEWPHAGKPVFVVTSRPIEAAAAAGRSAIGRSSAPSPTNSKGAAIARSASKAAASSSAG